MEAGFDAYEAGDFAAAAGHFREALARGEDPVKGWTNLAVALRVAGHAQAAAGCAARALALDEANAEGWGVLGAARLALGRVREAAEALRRAVALDPAEPIFRRNLGLAEQRAGDPAAALAAFDAGAALAPGDSRFRFQRATALLQLERYDEAWEPYEARFGLGELTHRGLDAKPLWTGEPLRGRRLLIYAEQGIGDALQFARFLPAALACARADETRGPEVALETHPPLLRFFADNFPGVSVFPYDAPAPAHDVRLPMTSLAGIAGGVPETGLRADGGYLGPLRRDPARPGRRPRVGLYWRGKTKPWDRSCPFPVLLRLAEAPGADFVSLQRDGAEEIEAAGAGALIETPPLGDFADDADLAADLDLVISVDTGTCHFAGALGMPVWTLLTHFNDWRFPPAGEQTRWYPTMRLFRMKRQEDWPGVIREATAALRALAGD